MMKVGLTGGLATGKSFVGRALAERGCYLIKADDIGREVMAPGGEAFDAIVREFGQEIVALDGSIDRKRLAADVFADPRRLAALNGIVHPPVIRREDQLIEEIGRRDPRAIIVCEAAVMIEAASYRRMNKLILTVCKEEQQLERAVERGLSREDALARILRQMPLEQKRRFADFVIDTSGTESETLHQVEGVYNLLQSMT